MPDDLTTSSSDLPASPATRFRREMVRLGENVLSFAALFVLLVLVVGAWDIARPYVMPWAEDQYLNWVDGDPYLKVWVNPDAQVYYPPSASAYGNTIPGLYLSQAEA